MAGWVIGAALNVVGNVGINFGYNVMKLGHDKMQRQALEVTAGDLDASGFPLSPQEAMNIAQERGLMKSSWSNKTWVLGVCAMMVGNICTFVSTAFAPVSLLAVLGSTQFVANVIFSSTILGETVTPRLIVATFFITGGCILLVLFGNRTSVLYTVADLKSLHAEPAWVGYLTGSSVGALCCYVLYRKGDWISKTAPQARAWRVATPVLFGLYAALLGTLTMVFSKSLSTLIRTTATGDNQAGSWFTWVVLLCFLFVSSFWVTRLNLGLRLFPATIIVPIMQTFWTLLSVVAGIVYFQEWKEFTVMSYITFPVGVAIVVLGITLLNPSKEPVLDTIGEYVPMDAEAARGSRKGSVQGALDVLPDIEQGGGLSAVPSGVPRTPELDIRGIHAIPGPEAIPPPRHVRNAPLATADSLYRAGRPVSAAPSVTPPGSRAGQVSRGHSTAEPSRHAGGRASGAKGVSRGEDSTPDAEGATPRAADPGEQQRSSDGVPALLHGAVSGVGSAAEPGTSSGHARSGARSPAHPPGTPTMVRANGWATPSMREVTAAESMAQRRGFPMLVVAPTATIDGRHSEDVQTEERRGWLQRTAGRASLLGKRLIAEAGLFLGLGAAHLEHAPHAHQHSGDVASSVGSPGGFRDLQSQTTGVAASGRGAGLVNFFGVQAGMAALTMPRKDRRLYPSVPGPDTIAPTGKEGGTMARNFSLRGRIFGGGGHTAVLKHLPATQQDQGSAASTPAIRKTSSFAHGNPSRFTTVLGAFFGSRRASEPADGPPQPQPGAARGVTRSRPPDMSPPGHRPQDTPLGTIMESGREGFGSSGSDAAEEGAAGALRERSGRNGTTAKMRRSRSSRKAADGEGRRERSGRGAGVPESGEDAEGNGAEMGRGKSGRHVEFVEVEKVGEEGAGGGAGTGEETTREGGGHVLPGEEKEKEREREYRRSMSGPARTTMGSTHEEGDGKAGGSREGGGDRLGKTMPVGALNRALGDTVTPVAKPRVRSRSFAGIGHYEALLMEMLERAGEKSRASSPHGSSHDAAAAAPPKSRSRVAGRDANESSLGRGAHLAPSRLSKQSASEAPHDRRRLPRGAGKASIASTESANKGHSRRNSADSHSVRFPLGIPRFPLDHPVRPVAQGFPPAGSPRSLATRHSAQGVRVVGSAVLSVPALLGPASPATPVASPAGRPLEPGAGAAGTGRVDVTPGSAMNLQSPAASQSPVTPLSLSPDAATPALLPAGTGRGRKLAPIQARRPHLPPITAGGAHPDASSLRPRGDDGSLPVSVPAPRDDDEGVNEIQPAS